MSLRSREQRVCVCVLVEMDLYLCNVWMNVRQRGSDNEMKLALSQAFSRTLKAETQQATLKRTILPAKFCFLPNPE